MHTLGYCFLYAHANNSVLIHAIAYNIISILKGIYDTRTYTHTYVVLVYTMVLIELCKLGQTSEAPVAMVIHMLIVSPCTEWSST